MRKKWFKTSIQHVSPPERAAIRTDRKCRSYHPVSSLERTKNAWNLNTPRLFTFFTNLEWNSKANIASSVLNTVLSKVAWKFPYLFSKLSWTISVTNHRRIVESIVPINHDATECLVRWLDYQKLSVMRSFLFFKEGQVLKNLSVVLKTVTCNIVDVPIARVALTGAMFLPSPYTQLYWGGLLHANGFRFQPCSLAEVLNGVFLGRCHVSARASAYRMVEIPSVLSLFMEGGGEVDLAFRMALESRLSVIISCIGVLMSGCAWLGSMIFSFNSACGASSSSLSWSSFEQLLSSFKF